jgi:predicted nucleotide-binding protein
LAKINQDLIARLAVKLGISDRAVYPHITKVANETMLDRQHAALVLAAKRGININKYSTPAERAEVRGVVHSGGGGPRDRDYQPIDAEGEIIERSARRRPAKKAKAARKRTKDNTVFVVHGRDGALRQSMFDFLRALNLHPLEWDHAIDAAKQSNPYVGDVLDIVMEQAEAIVVLFTPDDLAQLKEQFVKSGERTSEGKAQGQARPNVLFEAGLALGAHPKKTVMVQVGKVKAFSDIGGRHMVRLSNDEASRNSFANRLARICPAVNRIGNDWMHVGKFEPTESKPAKKRAGR